MDDDRVIAAEDTNDTVTAAEEFRFRGAASWSAGTIRYGDIERGRVAGDTQLLYLLASASLIEMTSELYAQDLVALFAEDREAVAWLQQRWAPEERQHGLALKRYVQAAWPDFDWDVAYRGFHAEFSCGAAKEPLAPSRALELAVRCVVETITSSFYGMLAATNVEPVLTQLASNIRTDEIRHYKYFYRYFAKYRARERPGRVAVLKTLLRRPADVQAKEAPLAFKHVYLARHPDAVFRRRDYVLYRESVRRMARHHLQRDMAVKMMLKPLGLGSLVQRVVRSLAMALCGVVIGHPPPVRTKFAGSARASR